MAKFHRPVHHTLSNGIPVVLQHYDGAVAATYWWVKTGSADEGKGEEGFAHFLEHMLFKDAAAKETGKASTGQMARAIESLGGDINAYTSFDQTVYHVTCASQHWEKVAQVFGTMAKPQKFLKSDFEREREVILEELRKNQDSPSRQLFQSLFTATYSKHPYGRPVIGFVKTLKAATVGKLEAFYRRNYVSGKMGIVLVGPLDPKRQDAMLKILEKNFGKGAIPRKSTPPTRRPVEPALRKTPTSVKRTFDVKTPTLAVAFRGPRLGHEDLPALDLAASVLSTGELSRLYQSLFYGTSIATDVSGGLYVPFDDGMLYFQAETDSIEKLPAAAEQMFHELARIRREGPTDEELARVLVNAESEKLYATQSADGLAGRLGFLQYIMGDLGYDQQYLEELRAVDRAAVEKVTAEYLDPRRMSLVLLLPKEHKDYDMAPITAMAERLLASPVSKAAVLKSARAGKAVVSCPAAGLKPEFMTTPSGIRVIYRENPQSHVMSLHASALGGLRLELGSPIDSREKDWGSSYLMALTWAKGSRNHDARKISEIVEGCAAGVDGFSGRNTVGLSMTGLARDFGKLSGLFTELLVEPTFPESEVTHSRRIAEDSVRGVEDHSSQLCSKLFLETLFETHPYGSFTTGSLESLPGIGSSKLKDFHRAWIRPERLTLAISGNVRRAELDRWMGEMDRSFAKLAKEPGRKISESLPEESALKAPRWAEKQLGREQTHIIVGGLGTRIRAEDRLTLQLLQTLLGGQSGRLFIELREKKSLAYTVAPLHFDGIEAGYVGTYIACSPSKRKEAVDGIKTVLEKLAEKGPTGSEVERAKQFFLGRRAMDLQSDSAVASHFGLEAVYGIPYLTDVEIAKRVQAIRARDIQELCHQYYVVPHAVTAVVG